MNRFDPWRHPGGWRQFGLTSAFRYRLGEEEVDVTLSRLGASNWLVRVWGEERTVRVIGKTSSDLVLELEARIVRLRVAESAERIWVGYAGHVFALERLYGSRLPVAGTRGTPGPTAARASPTAPMPGTVVKVAVTEGQVVDAHEPLLVLEAMKMEHVVEAPHAGVVRAVLFGEGDLVPAGAPVVELEET